MSTIQAQETDEGTVYVLVRDGEPPLSAHWPHPLLELEPGAQWLPSIDEGWSPRHAVTVYVGENVTKEYAAPREKLSDVQARLKRWRDARPKLTLLGGRKRSRSAFIDEETLRHVHMRHLVYDESITGICREMWEEWGYASLNSARNCIWDAIRSYGLVVRSQAEMTAKANRKRSMRLPGETKDEFRARRRRETGEIRGVLCKGVRQQYPRKGQPCSKPALAGSEFCDGHDPDRRERNLAVLAEARQRREANRQNRQRETVST